MFENDKENEFFTGGEALDLGSSTDDVFANFSLFDDDKPGDVLGDEALNGPSKVSDPDNSNTSEAKSTEDKMEVSGSVENTSQPEQSVSNKEQSKDPGKSPNIEAPDLFEEAIAKAEEKQAENTKNSLAEKLPVFAYASVKEEIADTSKTFDQLRKEKAEDFPELDDGTSVTWKMVYGTITKAISTPEETTIASIKQQIEQSKGFYNSLKKGKGDIECKVIPSVVAKKKGIISPYKGLCHSVEEAVAKGKVIAFVPSENGKVYEVRNTQVGTFIAETGNVTILEKVRAGLIPALPPIPYRILSEIIAFFRACITKNSELEALAYIYWSFSDSKYYVYIPRQIVSKTSVDALLPEMDEEKFALVMEIHSHNTMPAVFSPTDDKDERATGIYTVVGRLDKLFPDITTRISVGGKFVEINPNTVFERMNGDFPENWKDAIQKKHFEKKGVEL